MWKAWPCPPGTVLGWVLLMTLWLPMLDYGRSYAPQIARFANHPASPTRLCADLGFEHCPSGCFALAHRLEHRAHCQRCGAMRLAHHRHPYEWQARSNTYAAQWLPVRNVLRPTNRDDQWLVLQRRNP